VLGKILGRRFGRAIHLHKAQKANFGRGQNLPFGKAALQGFDKRTKNQREYGILL